MRVDETGGAAHMSARVIDEARVLLAHCERGLVIDRCVVAKRIAFAPCEQGAFIVEGVSDGHVMLVSNVRECVAFDSLDVESCYRHQETTLARL
jgi:hypothetical protein